MSGWLSVAITVILVVVAYLVLNRNIKARTSQQAALDEIKREVGAIITELNSTTERNIELIEDRIASLERLVGQADKRLGALRRDLATRSGESGAYSRFGRPAASSPAAQADSSFPQRTAGRTDAAPEHEGDSGAAAGTDEATGDTVRERVRHLYLQGVPLSRIATIVGKTVGEVELIVALDEGAGE
jgi:hypothetical protein